MELQDLNVYKDTLLSLSGALPGHRELLIRTAYESEDLRELLQEWLWLNDLGLSAAYPLKAWMGLSYRELGDVFGVSGREVGQAVRAHRAPSYQRDTGDIFAELSCFMVEQYLSSWIDVEIPEAKLNLQMQEHLRQCKSCRERLELYRVRDANLLESRRKHPSISEEEWANVLKAWRLDQRRRWIKLGVWIGVLIALLIILALVVWSKPEKMPNIYEIQE